MEIWRQYQCQINEKEIIKDPLIDITNFSNDNWVKNLQVALMELDTEIEDLVVDSTGGDDGLY